MFLLFRESWKVKLKITLSPLIHTFGGSLLSTFYEPDSLPGVGVPQWATWTYSPCSHGLDSIGRDRESKIHGMLATNMTMSTVKQGKGGGGRWWA